MRLFVPLLAVVPVLHAQSAPPRPAEVRVAAPAAAAGAVAYAIPGRTEPVESARIFTRATGIVQSRAFDIGDAVKAGDTLAVIEVPDLDRAIEAAKAAVDQARVLSANAKTLAGRSNELLASRAISQEESDQRSADHAAADANVRVAQASLARLEEQQKFATVRAPFDAVVAARNFDRGDRVRGDAATSEGWLYHLVRLDSLHFVVNASPDLALRLPVGAAAELRFGEFPGRAFPAVVARSSRIFDTTSGTMRVELLLENKDLAVPAGLTGTATFELQPAPGSWIVPANALILRAGKSSLAVVRENKVAYIDVLPGRNLGARLEVASAELSADLPVIMNPNALLRAGDSVSIVQ